MKLKMGCPVIVTKKLIRSSKTVDRKRYKYWKHFEFIKSRSGIFLGNRTLSNGFVEYDSDDGYSFDGKEYIKVALICLSERECPIYVPIDSVFPYIDKSKNFIIEE